MIPTWAKVSLGFLAGAGVGVGTTYLVCNQYYTKRENESVDSVKKAFKQYYEAKPIDIPKKNEEEPAKSEGQLDLDVDAYSSLTSVYQAEPKKPKKYNKRKNEDVEMDKPKLKSIHALTLDEFNEFGDGDDSAGKVTLTYFSKDKTLVDEYGDILWKDGKNADREVDFNWFAEFVDQLIDEDHIYILNPKKNTAYMIAKMEGRRGDLYVEEE